MTSLLDKLNLRPQERRLVVIVGIIVFVVLNFWFVFPHFGDWGRNQQKKKDAEEKLRRFKQELGKKSEYEREEARLAKMGQFLPSEEQALELQREVDIQARQSGVTVARWDATSRTGSTKTNSFFDEQVLSIQINTAESNLVEFLYNLGRGQSLTRVRNMNLMRDPSQTRLNGNITLVKSFQKKPPKTTALTVVASANTSKSAPAPTAKSQPAAKQERPSATKPETKAPTVLGKEIKPAPTPTNALARTNLARPLAVPTAKK